MVLTFKRLNFVDFYFLSIGWGRHIKCDKAVYDILKEVSLDIIDDKKCKSVTGDYKQWVFTEFIKDGFGHSKRIPVCKKLGWKCHTWK